jgi:hypothetical protein
VHSTEVASLRGYSGQPGLLCHTSHYIGDQAGQEWVCSSVDGGLGELWKALSENDKKAYSGERVLFVYFFGGGRGSKPARSFPLSRA